MTTIASDWDDIGAAVDYIRALRRVDRVSLVAWSLGGPRAGGYAAQHPREGERLVLLAPAYNRRRRPTPPAKMPADGVAFNTQSRAEFDANWDRQVGCPDAVRAGGQRRGLVRRCSRPIRSARPGGQACAARRRRRRGDGTRRRWRKMQTPTLMIAGVHDKQVPPERVRELYADLGSRAEGVRRPRLLVAQRDVGEEPPAAVPRLARMAREGHGQRFEGRTGASSKIGIDCRWT